MIEYLSISNLAVIKHTEIEFGEGLNVITGETGSGKSILVKALELLKGERANLNIIRSNEKTAKIQAIFDIQDSNSTKITEFIEDLDEYSLNVERVLSVSGKNRTKINDFMVGTRKLSEVMSDFIEITSQHSGQILLSSTNYLKILDHYAENTKEVEEIKIQVSTLDALFENLMELERKNQQSTSRIEELDFFINELENINLKNGEYKELLKQRNYATSIKSIMQIVTNGEELLYGGDNSAYDKISFIVKEIDKISDKVSDFQKVSNILNIALSEIEEAISVLRKFNELNQEIPDLEFIEKRLFQLERLFRKYEVQTELELLEILEKYRIEKDKISNLNDEIRKITEELNSKQKEIYEKSLKLRKKRINASEVLSKQISNELRELGFEKALFKIDVFPNKISETAPKYRIYNKEYFSYSGMDSCIFQFNPNPGGKWTLLNQGISGGELSRIHLALKSVLYDKQDNVVTVYDEIDTGIGGETGFKIGEKLKKASVSRQIINITHLPQIAVFADKHFVVEKHINENTTETTVRLLSEKEHIIEIARMTGSINEESLKYAQTMINKAKTFNFK